MAEKSRKRQTYVLTLDAVNRAISTLTSQSYHEHLPGYLAIIRAIASEHAEAAHSTDIRDFFGRFHKITGIKKPYIVPFAQSGQKLKNYNQNVAGSYSTSSIREDAPFRHVIDVSGKGVAQEYRLKEGHSQLALEHLLKGNKLPSMSMAAFYYREFGFELESKNISSVLKLFRDEFGLRESIPNEKSIYDTLFYNDLTDFSDNDLVELEKSNG